MDKVLRLSKATLVPLVLAFLYASLTASSEPTVRDCVWTQSVTGPVIIKDKTTLNILGTIFEGQVCPTNVTFSNCTACVNDQSNITISCHVIGDDLPKFMLEYGNGKRGVTDEPHLKGCKKKVIEKKETEIQSDRQSKTQLERQRSSLLAPFLAFLVCVLLLVCSWVIYRLWKKR